VAVAINAGDPFRIRVENETRKETARVLLGNSPADSIEYRRDPVSQGI